MHDHEHPQTTRRNQYRYLFTTKHHGGAPGAAQWRVDLSEDDEFAVFNGADEMQLTDEDHHLYGVLTEGDESLRFLGIWQEQVAEFPWPGVGRPWHGYPVWALNGEGPSNRRNPKHRPPKEVFSRMVEVGIITWDMRTRLMKGDYV